MSSLTNVKRGDLTNSPISSTSKSSLGIWFVTSEKQLRGKSFKANTWQKQLCMKQAVKPLKRMITEQCSFPFLESIFCWTPCVHQPTVAKKTANRNRQLLSPVNFTEQIKRDNCNMNVFYFIFTKSLFTSIGDKKKGIIENILFLPFASLVAKSR